MIAMLLFSVVAALLVFLAGRRDPSRDPRLTAVALALLALFPLLGLLLPEFAVLPVPVSGVSPGFSWTAIFMSIWAAGFFVAAVRLAFAAKCIHNWRKRSVLLSRPGGIEIRQLAGLHGPVAAGVFRPVVFVPEPWSRWSDETRRIVIDHETAHHRRRDPLWRWIAEIACAVHCYNPLVIWITRRLAMQCEYACDALVLQKGVSASDYARLLCDIAEDKAHRGPLLAMAERSTLESRVRRLINPQGRRGTAGLVVLIVLTCAFAAGLASVGSARKPKDVFSAEEVDLRWSADPFPGGE